MTTIDVRFAQGKQQDGTLTPWPVEDQHPDPQTDGLTDAELRATPVPVSDGHPDPQLDALTDAQLRAADVEVRDDYATESHATDQVGANAVLAFAVAPGSMVVVDVDPTDPTDFDNYRARATCDGSVPTASSGFVCRAGASTYLPVPTSGTVNVWAPTGVVVAVQSLGR